MKSNPKISIIVATYNAGDALKKTLANISLQEYSPIELIVIDGASKDHTHEVIKEYAHKIAYSISEKDRGIPDAYNKGIAAATGDWIYFLNADDIFVTDHVLADIFSNTEIAETLVVGKVVSDQGRVFDGIFSWPLMIRNQVHHQAIFYRADFIKQMPYNADYKRYGHDHEHNIKIWQRGINVKYVNEEVALWASGGISDSANWHDYKEEFRIRRNCFGLFGRSFNIFTYLRYYGKNLKRKFIQSN